MTNDIWLNLPVKDLAKSIHFFKHIGFQPNPGPGNTAQDMFAGFTRHALTDTAHGTEVLFVDTSKLPK